MSDIKIETVDTNALVDLFPEIGNIGSVPGISNPKFGAQDTSVDIFQTPPQPANNQPAVQPAKPVEGTATAATATATGVTPAPDPDKEVDILGAGVAEPPKVTTSLSDLSSYYQDRIKSGKFVAIEDTDDKGNPIPFIPKTPEEYDEVLELQINYRLDQAKKELQNNWYASKSPAWKVVGQFAELVDDPAQLIPFIQGVKTLSSIASLDENNIDAAEQIIRARLAQNGDPEEVINTQIDSLKTTGKLLEQAKQVKPIMVQQEAANLKRMEKEELERDRQYKLLVNEIREGTVKAIEAPMFGKTKLKNEEKAAIYDLIGEPAEETQGYAIFNALDTLFDKKNYDRLAEVALLLTNRDAFMNYLGINVANATAASLEKKLRLAGEARSASGNDFHEEGKPIVARNQYKTKPTFGR